MQNSIDCVKVNFLKVSACYFPIFLKVSENVTAIKKLNKKKATRGEQKSVLELHSSLSGSSALNDDDNVDDDQPRGREQWQWQGSSQGNGKKNGATSRATRYQTKA
jgi:hypothetical protein